MTPPVAHRWGLKSIGLSSNNTKNYASSRKLISKTEHASFGVKFIQGCRRQTQGIAEVRLQEIQARPLGAATPTTLQISSFPHPKNTTTTPTIDKRSNCLHPALFDQ